MDALTLAIGSFCVQLSGDSSARPHVAEELAPLASRGAGPDVRLVLTGAPAPAPPPEATIVGGVAAVEGCAWLRCPPTPWTLVVDLRGEVPLATVHIPESPGGRIAVRRHRARNRSYLSAAEQDAYLVVHFIVELLILLFAEEVSLVHSSAVATDGRALALVSTGGTGKTSGAAQLILRHGWSFLSDDIAPVTTGGEIVSWPRHIIVYPYNLVETPALRERVLGGEGRLGRLHWSAARALRGARGPRRRVAPEQLFGADGVSRGAAVEWAVFLSRWDGDHFRLDATDAATLAARSRHILAIEFGAPLKWLHEWAATGLAPLTPDELLDRQQPLIERALGHAREHHELRVPRKVHPRELADELQRLCLGDRPG